MDTYGGSSSENVSSGFETDPIETYGTKYFDIYENDSSNYSYNNRKLGDATGELGPFYAYKDADGQRTHNNWYADYSYFVNPIKPWFYRGGIYNDGVLASQLHFGRHSGNVDWGASFRLVLAI